MGIYNLGIITLKKNKVLSMNYILQGWQCEKKMSTLPIINNPWIGQN